jgi:flagellar M-ring protein FliF
MVAALASGICLYAEPVHAAASAVPQRQRIGDSRAVSRLAGVELSKAVAGFDADTVAFQNRLNSALQKMLDAVLGRGRAVVTTAAELDFDQIETVSTTYARDPSVGALSERLSRSSYTDNDGATRYESTSAVRANALNAVREVRRKAPGGVKRLSVAVLVDAAAGEAIDLAQLRTLVSVAAGVDPGRGDAVAVAAAPLNTGAVDSAQTTLAGSEASPTTNRQPMFIATGLTLLILVLLLAGLRRRRHSTRMAAERDHRRRMRGALQGQPATVAAAIAASPAPGKPRYESFERQRMIGQFPADPEQAAAVLRGWTGSGR